MKKVILILCLVFSLQFPFLNSIAQCSICAKTTLQMGEKPARGFNSGIIYLMLTPFAIIGIVGYKLWKNNKEN